MISYLPLLLLIILIISLSYFVSSSNENFTKLTGFNPLVSYDDYGTFNGIMHTNDIVSFKRPNLSMREGSVLPYYDPTYNNMTCIINDYQESDDYLNNIEARENINFDSFISNDGLHKVRRNLVPKNYTEHTHHANAEFDLNQRHLAIKKDRPQASQQPPQPHNIYFN